METEVKENAGLLWDTRGAHDGDDAYEVRTGSVSTPTDEAALTTSYVASRAYEIIARDAGL